MSLPRRLYEKIREKRWKRKYQSKLDKILFKNQQEEMKIVLTLKFRNKGYLDLTHTEREVAEEILKVAKFVFVNQGKKKYKISDLNKLVKKRLDDNYSKGIMAKSICSSPFDNKKRKQIFSSLRRIDRVFWILGNCNPLPFKVWNIHRVRYCKLTKRALKIYITKG